MSLISSEIPALNGGVSQQPSALRLPTQLEEMENGRASITEGNTKRNPVEYLQGLPANLDLSSAYIHTINRDVTERYLVVLADGVVRVFGLDDYQERTVTVVGDAATYLAVSDATAEFGAVTVNDYTFVINKTVRPALASATAPGSVTGTVQTFEDLPNDPAPINGVIYEIAGDPGSNFDDYYVKRVAGAWTEGLKPGEQYQLDGDTMPHILVRMPDGTFEFRAATWNDRTVGTLESDPEPSFIDRTIRDIFWFQSRLCMLTDENVIMSGVGTPFNFWRTTVVDLLAADRLDVAVSATSVAKLQHAIPFARQIALIGEQQQFVLNASQGVAPDTVAIDPMTTLEVDTRARPAKIATDVYLPVPTGRFTRVHELTILEGQVSEDTADVTGGVPEYIPGNIRRVVSIPSQEMLVLLSADDPSALYVYETAWQGQERVQSAWHKWTLGDDVTIRNIDALDETLYVLADDADKGHAWLGQIRLEFRVAPTGMDNQVYLDQRVETTGSYDSGNDRTTVTVPYKIPQGSIQLVDPRNERLIDPTSYTFLNDFQLRVPGDYPDVVLGVPYTHRFKFSRFHLPRRADSPARVTGRLTINTLQLYYSDTAYFRVVVRPYAGATNVAEVVPAGRASFTGRTLGAASFQLNSPGYSEGIWTVLVGAAAENASIEVLNDTHVRASLFGAEWQGTYFKRARMI